MANRVLFLSDGLIVRDQPRSDAGSILETMNELAALTG